MQRVHLVFVTNIFKAHTIILRCLTMNENRSIYNPWPLGQLPQNFQRPEIDLLRKAGYKIKDPREAITLFEKKLSDFTGAPHVVVLDNCTDATFLMLYYWNRKKREGPSTTTKLVMPARTYISVPQSAKQAGWPIRFVDFNWSGLFQFDPLPVYDALERKTAGCIRGSISNASHLGQTIVLKSMQGDNFTAEKEEKFEILQNRARCLKKVLSDSKYKEAWDAYPFNSGYFMCIRLKTVHAETLRLHLLEKYGVGLISIGDKDLRIAFSCLEESEIPELFNIILQGIQDIEGRES